MKELKGIDQKTVVSCPTEELFNKVISICSIFKVYSGGLICWIGEKTLVSPFEGKYGTRYGFPESQGYTILPAEEFIRLNSFDPKDYKMAFTPDIAYDEIPPIGYPKDKVEQVESQTEIQNL